jgi:hypothetical protein
VSYDVCIGDVSLNYTSNGSALFYEHIPETETHRGGLHALHGLTGRQASEVLSDAWEAIHRTWMTDWREHTVGSPDFCARYDAPNGWGSTVGGLLFLARITAACAAHPRHRVSVCA